MWFKNKLRVIFLGMVLLVGLFFGMPMRPQDIEELLHASKRVKAEESAQDEEQDFSDDDNVGTDVDT